MTSAERDEVAARKRTLAEGIDRARQDERRRRVQVTWIMVAMTALAVAGVVGSIATGHRSAALAYGFGIVVFSAYSFYVRRPIQVATTEETELARLEKAPEHSTVHVFDIEADTACVLAERPAQGTDVAVAPFGYVLRVDRDHYVYVRSETCAGIDPARLPNSHLSIEQALPHGLLRAAARGVPIVTASQIVCITREHADTVLVSELVDFEEPWDELLQRLSAAAS